MTDVTAIQVEALPLHALNWLVAELEGLRPKLIRDRWFPHALELRDARGGGRMVCGTWNPAGNWGQGGPLGERERIQSTYKEEGAHQGLWMGLKCVELAGGQRTEVRQYGVSELEAKMRCLVAFRYGSLVNVPVDVLED